MQSGPVRKVVPRIVRRDAGNQDASTPLELFFDLVFAFTITQVSHVLIGRTDATGAIQFLIVLLAGWWSWNYTTWLTDELSGDSTSLRLLLIGLMGWSLLMAIAIPEAFGERGLLFAGAYVAIQLGRHGFLTFIASGPGTEERQRSGHILIWFLAAGVFWIGGAFAHGDLRLVIWGIALVIDYGGPRMLYRVPGRPRLSGTNWQVHPVHMVDRYAGFIILTLGETVAITGAMMTDARLTPARLIAFMVAFLGSAAFWWLHFARAGDVPELLSRTRDLTLVVRAAFVYGHVLLVGGVLLSAVGDAFVIARPLDPLSVSHLLPVILGPVVFLLVQAFILWRITNERDIVRIGAACGALVIGAIAAVLEWPAVVVSGVVLVLLAVAVALAIAPDALPREEAETGDGS